MHIAHAQGAELFALLRNEANSVVNADTTDVPAEIRRLISEGAGGMLARSNIIHMAVSAKKLWPYLDLFLDLTPSGTLDLPDKEGMTPLHHAALNAGPSCRLLRADISMAKKLLDLGADKTIKDAKGRTPLDAMYAGIKAKHTALERRHGRSSAADVTARRELAQALIPPGPLSDAAHELIASTSAIEAQPGKAVGTCRAMPANAQTWS